VHFLSKYYINGSKKGFNCNLDAILIPSWGAIGEKGKLEVISHFSFMSWVPSLVLVIFDGKTINL